MLIAFGAYTPTCQIKKIYGNFGHMELLPYLCETNKEYHMIHPIAEMTPENRKKLDKLITSKLKSIPPIQIEGIFGKGELIVVKAEINPLRWGPELNIKIQYVEKSPTECGWMGKRKIGIRRNSKIRDIIFFNSGFESIYKPFGIRRMDVVSITVKK